MIVSLAEMKEYLGIPSSDTSQDDFLTEQLQLISDTVEAYCRRRFEQTTYVQTFYGNENEMTREITLFAFPVISVASIVEDGITLPSSDYRLHKPTGTIRRPAFPFFACKEETVITYTAGYAMIPPILKNVVKSLVQERYNRKQSGVNLSFGSDVQRISVPGTISIDFDYSLQNNEREAAFGTILGNYVNQLDYFRSERALVGSTKLEYVEETP